MSSNCNDRDENGDNRQQSNSTRATVSMNNENSEEREVVISGTEVVTIMDHDDGNWSWNVSKNCYRQIPSCTEGGVHSRTPFRNLGSQEQNAVRSSILGSDYYRLNNLTPTYEGYRYEHCGTIYSMASAVHPPFPSPETTRANRNATAAVPPRRSAATASDAPAAARPVLRRSEPPSRSNGPSTVATNAVRNGQMNAAGAGMLRIVRSTGGVGVIYPVTTTNAEIATNSTAVVPNSSRNAARSVPNNPNRPAESKRMKRFLMQRPRRTIEEIFGNRFAADVAVNGLLGDSSEHS